MSLLRIRELEQQLARAHAHIATLEQDSARLDFLDKIAVICKPGKPIRHAIDEEMKRRKS